VNAAAGPVRRLGASLLTLGRIRLELLAIEVQEEKERIAALLFWALLSALLVGFALVFVAATITVMLWDTHRLLVLGFSAATMLALATVGVVKLRGLTRHGHTLFASSLAELRRDAAALGPSPLAVPAATGADAPNPAP
jgi:uncharacterized membrane protein YqjE